MSEICYECKETNKKEEWNNNFQLTSNCLKEYNIVDNCMKEYNGNISQCKNEWNNFKICFNLTKNNENNKK